MIPTNNIRNLNSHLILPGITNYNMHLLPANIPHKRNKPIYYTYILPTNCVAPDLYYCQEINSKKIVRANQIGFQNEKKLRIQITWKNVSIYLNRECFGLCSTKKEQSNGIQTLPTNNQRPYYFYSAQMIHGNQESPSNRTFINSSFKNILWDHQNDLSNKYQKKQKLIIDNISGTVRPGQFLTIIGPSECGKTTLLSYLAGKNVTSKFIHEGEVLLNDIPRNQLDYSPLIAFVQQDDVLSELMSVRENIFFACQLRSSGSEQEMNARCDEIINTLGLNQVQNQRIGGIMKKIISGGERKRTSIAIEIGSRTPIIFLDEPTTGLDSVMATKVTEALSIYAKNGNTIIATIHQPNSDMIRLFDQLMILSQGKVIYFNHANNLVTYFLEFNKPKYICPERINPMEFAMILINPEAFTEQSGENININNFSIEDPISKYEREMETLFNYYEQSKYKCNISITGQNLSELLKANIYSVIFKANPFSQFKILYIRAITLLLRSFLPSILRYSVVILLVLLTIGCFYNLNNVGPSLVFDRMALGLIISLIDFMMSLNTAITLFPDERALFIKEQVSGLYDCFPYYLTKLFCYIPFILIDPIITRLVLYWSCPLRNEVSIFFISLCSGFLVELYGFAFALFLGIVIGKREAIFFHFQLYMTHF